MSNRFTPRGTLQATPAVCKVNKPPVQRPNAGPEPWQLPDILHAWGLFPDPNQISTRVIPYSLTLTRQGVGVDTWSGDNFIWNTVARWDYSLDHATGVHNATIRLNPIPQVFWFYGNFQYPGKWPQFNTDWQNIFTAPPFSFNNARLKITL